MEPLFFIIIALIIGAATRHFFKKTPLPYTVLLLLIGLILGVIERLDYLKYFHSFEGAIKWAGNIRPEVILFVFLPTLIFEAAFAMDLHTFKKTAVNATLLAIPGIILALFITGALVILINVLHLGFGSWGWSMALMFGAVASATDPVAVVALLKELGASKKLSTLIEGESLLNDGTAIVIFMVFFTGITGANHGDSSVLNEFTRVVIGGTLIGLIIGGVTLAWVKRVFNDAMVEISLIIAAAYLTFYMAEHFMHVSGVLGLVALGLTMASAGRTRISAEVSHFLHEFWGLAAFIANTLIFIIVGVVIAEKTVFAANNFIVLGILYIGIHLARGIMIIALFPFMKRFGYGLPKKDGWVLWYGGLRGAVGLALTLVVAGEESIPADIRQEFLFYMAGIVVLTLLINATTIKMLIRILGLADIPAVKALMFNNMFGFIQKDVAKEAGILGKDTLLSGTDWNEVNKFLPKHEMIPIEEEDIINMDPYAETRRRLMEKEKGSYWIQYKEGLLSPLAYTKLTDNLKEVMDKEGKISLSEREYLTNLWQAPKLLANLQTLKSIGHFFHKQLMEKLAIRYDTVKGFVTAQEEVAKLVETMDFDMDQDNIIDEYEIKLKQTLISEITQNKVRGLNYLKEMHEAYPEITKAIETRQTVRSLLNFEKKSIQKLHADGRLEEGEAIKLITDVESRMKSLMELKLITKLPKPDEIIEELSWLKNADQSIIDKVKSLAIEKHHAPDEVLVKQGESGDSGMLVIARGAAVVMVNDTMVDILGAGRFLGEMSVLAGINRTATVIADTPVTALWLPSKAMQEIIRESPELEQSLWNTAGLRFAENLLGKIDPFRNWSQHKLRRWLGEGIVRKVNMEEKIHLHNNIALLIAGKVELKEGNIPLKPPAVITTFDFTAEANSWLYISAAIHDAE